MDKYLYRELYNKVSVYMLETYGVFTTDTTLKHDYLHMALGLDTSIVDEMVLSAVEFLLEGKKPYSWFSEDVLNKANTIFSSTVCSDLLFKNLIFT